MNSEYCMVRENNCLNYLDRVGEDMFLKSYRQMSCNSVTEGLKSTPGSLHE